MEDRLRITASQAATVSDESLATLPPMLPDCRFGPWPENDRDRAATQNVAKGHFRTHALAAKESLFDNLVGAGEDRLR
jgi:hypothetical protein